MQPTLNKPYMTHADVVASRERGNQIVAMIRAGTYRSPVRSTADLANAGYRFNPKWSDDAAPFHYLGKPR